MNKKDVYTSSNNPQTRGDNFNNPLFDSRSQLFLFLVGWLGFQVIAIIFDLIALLILKDPEASLDSGVSMAINCASYGTLLVSLILIIKFDGVKKLLPSFKSFKPYVAGLICLIVILAFNNIYSIIVSLFRVNLSNNANETNIRTITQIYAAPSLIFFGLIGPICEELTYRVGLFSLCKRKSEAFAYIITMIVFAFIHFNFDTSSLVNELLNLPYYAFAAFAFSFTYERYGFAGSVTAHILNNLLSLSVSIFSK